MYTFTKCRIFIVWGCVTLFLHAISVICKAKQSKSCLANLCFPSSKSLTCVYAFDDDVCGVRKNRHCDDDADGDDGGDGDVCDVLWKRNTCCSLRSPHQKSGIDFFGAWSNLKEKNCYIFLYLYLVFHKFMFSPYSDI